MIMRDISVIFSEMEMTITRCVSLIMFLLLKLGDIGQTSYFLCSVSQIGHV
jgi:hypothetical protein